MNKLFTVNSSFNETRIDKWIRNNIANIPQSLIEKCLRKGKIKVNKKKVKSSYKVKTDDKINTYDLKFKDNFKQKKLKFRASNEVIKSNENLIIDNNPDFIVVNKNAGISVQGGTKSRKNLVDIFSKSKIFENSKPFPVHRLDKDTSGILMIAKNRETAKLLTSLFRLRRIHKTYLAICHGEIIQNKGEWNNKLIRYEGKKEIIENAKTFYKVIDKNSLASLVELKPITGRKHQIRKHLFFNGNPIFGDQKYKFENNTKSINKNLMLHSFKLKFMINEKKYTYTALLPEYFKKLMKLKRLSMTNFL